MSSNSETVQTTPKSAAFAKDCAVLECAMYEIELKAHVKDRIAVAHALDIFARYEGSLTKRDTYYRLPLVCVPIDTERSPSKRTDTKVHSENTAVQDHIGCRIRKTVFEKTGETKITFTYKRKELRKDADGIAIEVNDEKECTLSETDAIESFIKDAGGGISHIKEKIIKEWYAETEAGAAHIELCTVPPLGDFLEIEVLAKDDAHTEDAKRAILSIFKNCGIDKSAIESRYYSDMLDEEARVNTASGG
ncbi:CYTH domain-containing protein [Treponema socranskii]|uniref:CYTH domain-containing protein n=1 Tax=Treponema socranskii TaxID=53419 RepID=UPI003D8A78DE